MSYMPLANRWTAAALFADVASVPTLARLQLGFLSRAEWPPLRSHFAWLSARSRGGHRRRRRWRSAGQGERTEIQRLCSACSAVHRAFTVTFISI